MFLLLQYLDVLKLRILLPIAERQHLLRHMILCGPRYFPVSSRANSWPLTEGKSTYISIYSCNFYSPIIFHCTQGHTTWHLPNNFAAFPDLSKISPSVMSTPFRIASSRKMSHQVRDCLCNPLPKFLFPQLCLIASLRVTITTVTTVPCTKP